MKSIPFIRSNQEDSRILSRYQEMVQDIIAKRDFQNGRSVRVLEGMLSDEFDVPYAAAFGSGTTALRMALYALDLKPGSRVAVTSFSFYSTATLLLQLGLIPVFVDIDRFYQLRIDQLGELVRSREVDAIVVAHMHGQLVDTADLYMMAREQSIPVLEDAAQGFSAQRFGHKAAAFSDIACLSFSPTKVIGAYGNGGAVLTRNEQLYSRLTSLRWHGISPIGIDKLGGENGLLDSFQAAAIHLKIPFAKENLSRRMEISCLYKNELESARHIVLPECAPGSQHSYHKYVVQISNRDDVQKKMKSKGVECKVHYPLALPDNPIFSERGFSAPFGYANAQYAAERVLSLPMYADLTDQEVRHVCSTLKWACQPL